MTLSDTNSVGFAAPIAQDLAQVSAKPATNAQDQQKLEKAAGEFESILLASMWKSMKQSFGATDDASDPAHGTLDDWGIEIMSGAVGKAGGLGIGKLIVKHLEPALEADPQPSTPKSHGPTDTKQIT
jgi:Rod binding domain-containing protein